MNAHQPINPSDPGSTGAAASMADIAVPSRGSGASLPVGAAPEYLQKGDIFPSFMLSDPATGKGPAVKPDLPAAPADSADAGGQPDLYEAARSGMLFMRWSAIRSSRADEVVVCGAAEPVILSDVGLTEPGLESLTRLEGAGLLRDVELAFVDTVMRWLERHRHVQLSVPLVAQGIVARGIWPALVRKVANRRDLCVRLTVDLRFRSGAPTLRELAELANSSRKLGLRLLLSGFGDGDLSLGHIMAAKPTGVRIAPVFAARAAQSQVQRDQLAHIVALIDGLAGGSAAIVDGVEDTAAARLARDCGARWITGRYCGAAVQGVAPVQIDSNMERTGRL